MPQPLRTCAHIYDTGGTCNSVAAVNQRFCPAHLHHRARLMRIAQARARAERFDLHLPPIESTATALSAVNRLIEAVAADMIDLKRARFLLTAVRLGMQAVRHPEQIQQPSLFHTGEAIDINVSAEYNLPPDINLDVSPETVYPAPDELIPTQTDNPQLVTDNSSASADTDFRPDFPISPEWLEVRDISNTHGEEAAAQRFRQLERNRARRELRTSRRRYADLALRLNFKKAAEHLADRKLVERLQEVGIPGPAASQPLGCDAQIAVEDKKLAASVAEIDACLAGQEVKIA